MQGNLFQMAQLEACAEGSGLTYTQKSVKAQLNTVIQECIRYKTLVAHSVSLLQYFYFQRNFFSFLFEP